MPVADSTLPVRRHSLGKAISRVLTWLVLWAILPSGCTALTKPYVRQVTFTLPGQSHAEAEAELNIRYAWQLLGIGAGLGLVAGLIALLLRRMWQWISLSVITGSMLEFIFEWRNAPPYWTHQDMIFSSLLFGIAAGMVAATLFFLRKIVTNALSRRVE